MLTIFSIPKPFTNSHINIIQRNAIQSWINLGQQSEVILFGDDAGVGETAAEFGIKHIPEIKKNKFGTPLINSAFALAKKHASHKILTYVNADIIFLSDIISTIKQK